MGDRAYCELTIFGTTTEERWADVCENIDAEQEFDDFHFGFDEVNYAQLDANLEGALQRAGLSYIWHNSPGGEYPEGVLCYDAETQETQEFVSDGFDLLIRMSEVPQLDLFHKWQAWIKAKAHTGVKIEETT